MPDSLNDSCCVASAPFLRSKSPSRKACCMETVAPVEVASSLKMLISLCLIFWKIHLRISLNLRTMIKRKSRPQGRARRKEGRKEVKKRREKRLRKKKPRILKKMHLPQAPKKAKKIKKKRLLNNWQSLLLKSVSFNHNLRWGYRANQGFPRYPCRSGNWAQKFAAVARLWRRLEVSCGATRTIWKWSKADQEYEELRLYLYQMDTERRSERD